VDTKKKKKKKEKKKKKKKKPHPDKKNQTREKYTNPLLNRKKALHSIGGGTPRSGGTGLHGARENQTQEMRGGGRGVGEDGVEMEGDGLASRAIRSKGGGWRGESGVGTSLEEGQREKFRTVVSRQTEERRERRGLQVDVGSYPSGASAATSGPASRRMQKPPTPKTRHRGALLG